MGRVTLFSIHGCPFCIKAKKSLKERDIPFSEINISDYPSKRTDMLSLSDSLTVPQIFFNENHIGGATELLSLLEKWGEEAFKKYEDEVKSQQDPSDPRLDLPTGEPIVEKPASARLEEDKVELPNGDTKTVLEVTKELIDILSISDLTYRGKLYKSVTPGKIIVSDLVRTLASNATEAENFASYLQKRKIIHHVTEDHDFTSKGHLFFRLQPFQRRDVLNSFRVWTDRVDPDYMLTMSRLSKLVDQIMSKATNSDGNVDMIGAAKDEKYMKFEEEVCELQGIQMEKMDIPTKTSFLINVYNLMIKYAQIKVGVASSNITRASFFTGVRVNIGGQLFSFHELENGLLRANAVPPYSVSKLFTVKDPRLSLALGEVDPRIHFALNCGAKSCPPVKKFTPSDLEEELRIVAMAFCEQNENAHINEEKKQVHLSTIFKWYRADFAKSNALLPRALLPYLRGEKKESLERLLEKNEKSIKVMFNDYDWGSDASKSKDFKAGDLKSDSYTICGHLFPLFN